MPIFQLPGSNIKAEKSLGKKPFSALVWYSRRESNPNRRNRNPIFYPLNYGNISSQYAILEPYKVQS